MLRQKNCKIFIDASAELGPIRYSLPPAKEELAKAKEKISKLAEKCDIITISHYHYDENAEYYKDKIVYAKDGKENINQSQKQRAKNNLLRIAKNLNGQIILDHHFK